MWNECSPYQAPGYEDWQRRLASLPPTDVHTRVAEATAEDARWMWWIQADSESANIHDVASNTERIKQKVVVLAEIDGCPVGFCEAFRGSSPADPLFIQMVAVVPRARRRGAALALLHAAATAEPQRDIVGATLDENIAARSLNERFAESLDASIQRVPVRSFCRSDMGFGPGEEHRPWLIRRASQPRESD
ncbi:GNAT family N-acetyltransferase [Microbacterium sp. 2P01SA-2]|uniref:GNAT family N-acetyltransferase n=1 Tax=unclassified Microbacterium TaxID=2609290 RepID=UPI0039A17543